LRKSRGERGPGSMWPKKNARGFEKKNHPTELFTGKKGGKLHPSTSPKLENKRKRLHCSDTKSTASKGDV